MYAIRSYYAIVETEKGNFKLEFLPQYAPVSVGNFCTLVNDNFYNNVEFHRVVPGFVVITSYSIHYTKLYEHWRIPRSFFHRPD